MQTATQVQAQQCADPYSPATWLLLVEAAPTGWGSSFSNLEIDYAAMNTEIPCESIEDTNCNCFPEGLVNWDGMCGRNGTRVCRAEMFFNDEVNYWPLTHSEKMTELWN